MPDAARPGELVATLTLLRERIAKLAARSRLSLAATKRELVEPLLAALGWQTGDPESVRAPYRPPGGQPAPRLRPARLRPAGAGD
jgi:hypothetical protein